MIPSCTDNAQPRSSEAIQKVLRGKRILVTGGLGFIGSNLAIELVRCGARVTIVDLPNGSFGANEFNIETVRGDIQLLDFDIRDSERLAQAAQGCDLIFCLAGQVSHAESMRQPLLDLDLNCRAQLAILESCRLQNPTARIVFTSTRQIYGRPETLPVNEKHPIRPVDVNGISKLAAEQFYWLYYRLYGIRSTCLRLTNTYGPRMDLRDASKGFVGVFLARALRGQSICIFGDGQQRRDFNHVDDVVDALIVSGLSEHTGGRIYNLSHPQPYSLLQVTEILSRLLPVPFECVPFPPERKAIDVGDYFGCSRLFQDVTGWQPRIDLPSGLASTVEFFQQHRHRYLDDG
ncbi:MAG: NAD-dependent epimerase/dehydratase family protein [Planctomycetaceae bacterium]